MVARVRIAAVSVAALACVVPSCGPAGQEAALVGGADGAGGAGGGGGTGGSEAGDGRGASAAEPAAGPETVRVPIGGRSFKLELAADTPTRTKGLGGRSEIAEDGGMIFVFPDQQVQVLQFLMRDCLADIDIIFLDPSGRITAMHGMKKEPPRGPGEGVAGDLSSRETAVYESRLRKYSSRFAAQFAIELRGGTLAGLKLEAGQKINIDTAALKAKAR